MIQGSGPAARNAVPIADYTADRADSIGAFYGLGASAVARGDEVGRYARFFFNLDPTLTTGPPIPGAYGGGGCSTWCFNAYPEPGDARDNQPFSGTYPRLLPYDPPSRKSVLRR